MSSYNNFGETDEEGLDGLINQQKQSNISLDSDFFHYYETSEHINEKHIKFKSQERLFAADKTHIQNLLIILLEVWNRSSIFSDIVLLIYFIHRELVKENMMQLQQV
jgi:hypothetical protein